MTITDFIPYGKENAVSREYLANMTGLDDRTVRELIEKARKDVPIISLKKGYYLPLVEEERQDVQRWLITQGKRGSAIFNSTEGAIKWLKEHPPRQMKWEV